MRFNPKFSKYLILIFALVLLVGLYFYYDSNQNRSENEFAGQFISYSGRKLIDTNQLKLQTTYPLNGEKSENPLERVEWEMQQLINPKTGKIPKNIRQRSLNFLEELNVNLENMRSEPSGFQSNQNVDFTSFGPVNVGGRTRALAIDVNNEDVILAGGVSGGMWKSTDGGESWIRTTALEDHPAVSYLIQDRREDKTDEWYYSTGELRGNSANASGAFFFGNGIYKSEDNGDTWGLISSTAVDGTSSQDFVIEDDEFTVIHKLAIDFSEPNGTEIYAAGLSKIFKSDDGFKTWRAVLGQQNTGRNFSDVAVTSNGIVYAVIANAVSDGANPETGFFKSSDGENFQKLTPTNPIDFVRFVIGIDPNNESLVYFLSDDQLLLYNNVSDSWTDLSSNVRWSDETDDTGDGLEGFDGYTIVVEVLPGDSEVIFLGGTNILRSEKAFREKGALQIGGYDNDKNPNLFFRYPNHHPDQHVFTFYPSNPKRMLNANDGGVYVTEDNLQNLNSQVPVRWKSLNNGYLTTQFYHGSIHQYNFGDNQIVGGMQDNNTRMKFTTDPSENWEVVTYGDGGYSALTYNGLITSSQRGGLWRLRLVNDTYTGIFDISPSRDNVLFINPFTFNPVQQDQIFFAGQGKVFFTNDVRDNPTRNQWGAISAKGLEGINVSALSVSHQPEGVLYFGTRVGRIFKVEDVRTLKDQDEAIRLNDDPLPAGNINDIAVDPTDADRVMIGFSNYEIPSIFISEDGGDTWTDVSGNLEENPDGSGAGPSVRAVRMMPDGLGGYYYFAGTSVGLFMTRTLDGANTVWEQQGANQIGNVVVSSIQFRAIDGTVLVTTHGNGVFKGHYEVGIVPFINYTFSDSGTLVTMRGNRSFDADNPLGYQWYVDGEAIDGANDSEFVADNGGDYQLQVFNQNEQSGFSNTVTLKLDGLAPEITSIVRANPLGEDLTETTAQFTVTFNEAVTNVTPESFATSGTASGVPTIVEETTEGLVFDVTVTGIGGSGALSLVGSSSVTITDLAGNLFEGVILSSESYNVIDTTEPSVTITRRNPTEETTNANEVSFTVDFSESVNNLDILDFVFGTGSPRAELDTVIAITDTKTFELRVNEIAADGRLSIGFAPGQDIEDLAGNAFTGEVVSTEDFLIDNVIASIDEELVINAEGIVVDKNPSTGIFYVAFPSEYAGKIEIQVVDASGRGVESLNIENYKVGEQVRLDLTTQQDGVYLMRAIGAKERATIKLLKQR